jgi:hypothetical protein
MENRAVAAESHNKIYFLRIRALGWWRSMDDHINESILTYLAAKPLHRGVCQVYLREKPSLLGNSTVRICEHKLFRHNVTGIESNLLEKRVYGMDNWLGSQFVNDEYGFRWGAGGFPSVVQNTLAATSVRPDDRPRTRVGWSLKTGLEEIALEMANVLLAMLADQLMIDQTNGQCSTAENKRAS